MRKKVHCQSLDEYLSILKIMVPQGFCFFVLETFQNIEGHFLLSVVADESLDIPAILNSRQYGAKTKRNLFI
jgi:hypothetical protein